MKHHGQILTSLAALVFFIAVPAILGQRVQQQDPDSRITQEPRPGGDPIRQLNLSPEQLEQIRTIREQNQKERAAINERVRETNRALQAVLEAYLPE